MEKINPRAPNMEVALNNEVDRITVNWWQQALTGVLAY